MRHGVELACGQLIEGAEKPIAARIRSEAADIVLDDAGIVRECLSERHLSRAGQVQCLNPSPKGRVAERSEAGWGVLKLIHLAGFRLFAPPDRLTAFGGHPPLRGGIIEFAAAFRHADPG
jgi:hypothetical protein